MPRTATLVAVMLGLPLGGLPAAPSPPVSVVMHDGLVRMELPGGWTEIPAVLLENLTYWAADATAGRIVEVYQHGFQPVDPEPDSGLPQLLVQIRRDGRQNLRPYLRLPSLERTREHNLEEFRHGVPPLVLGVQVERLAFDRDRYILHLEHALDLKVRGRVRVLTAAFLTDQGFVVLHFVDRERRIGDGRRLFDDIVSGVEIAPELAYRPTLLERFPGLPYFAAASAVLAALVLYLATRSRRSS